MKIEIYRKEKVVYVKYNDVDKELLFEALKELGKLILDNKLENKDESYEVVKGDGDALDLYKETVDKLISSIESDDELFKLYSSTRNVDENKADEIDD